MKRYLKAAAVALAVVLAGCFLFWLGGYDFNERGLDVALGAVLLTWVAGMAAVFVYIND